MPRLSLALGIWLAVVAAGPSAAATDPFDECERAFEEGGGWNGCGCFYTIAIGQRNLQEEAARRLEAHLIGSPGDPCLTFNLGRLRLLAGHPSAGELLLEAADGFRRLGEPEGEVYAHINRILVFRSANDPAAAMQELEPMRQAIERLAEPDRRAQFHAQADLQEANLALDLEEDLESVERLLLDIEARAFEDGEPWFRRELLNALGGVRYLLGRYGDAETCFRRMIDVTREAGDTFGEATAFQNLVISRLARGPGPGRREEILVLLREAIEKAAAAGQRVAEADARLRLGKILGGEDGRRQLEESLRLAGELGHREIRARALGALAVHDLPASPDKAAEKVDEALVSMLDSPAFGSATHGWSDRMEVVWATRPREEAAAEGLATLGLIERLRDRQRAEGGRARVFAPLTEVYYALAGRLLDPDQGGGEAPDLDRAFAVHERLRARVLLESLVTRGDEPMPEAGELARALAELVDVNRRLLDPRLGEVERSLQLAELDRLERREAELRDAAARASGATLGSTEFATLADVRSALAPDEALLAFQIAPWQSIYGAFAGGSWLLAVTREERRLYRLPGGDELEPGLKVFLHLFSRRDGSENEAAGLLFDQLLRDAITDLPGHVRRLVLIPDGALHRLPFAVLRDAGDVPLVQSFELSNAPSATLWLRWRSRSKAPANGEAAPRALILADPRPVFADAVSGNHVTSSWTLSREAVLAPLPNAVREGRAVARVLGRGSELFVGQAASEKALESALEAAGRRGAWDVVHFAAHAVVDGHRPHRSAVVLSPGGPGEDGLLLPREIAELELDGSVVVLSTCRSAAGTVLAGEGPLSLTRAFFTAGARTVVASHWPLRDDEAAELFESFYRHLGRGVSVARALAEAQAERLAAGAPAEAWAGVSVFGDGNAVPVPGGRRAGLPALAGWAALVAALSIATLQIGRRLRERTGVG